MKREILQQHKELVLICEKGIYVIVTHNTFFVPQTTGTCNLVVGN
jgi:hypothetical protein